MLVKLYEDSPNQREIDKVIEVLRNGGIVIYPTDTLYALGCDALNVRAVEKICALKGINPQRNNLSIICYDLSDISEYAKVNTTTFKLMRKNLPGPFTFILNTTSTLPKIYKNRKTVGIRVLMFCSPTGPRSPPPSSSLKWLAIWDAMVAASLSSTCISVFTFRSPSRCVPAPSAPGGQA